MGDTTKARPKGRTFTPWLEVRCALELLTRLPVGSADPERSGSAAFGLVGAGLGMLAALPSLIVSDQPLLAAAAALGILAMLSGALHLDGLADLADALAAPDAERAQRALRDPAIGAAGAGAITLVLLVQVGSLSSLASVEMLPALVIAGTASRTAPAVAAPWLPRAKHGFGAWFAVHSGGGGAALAMLSSLVISLNAGHTWGAVSWLTGVAFGVGLLVFVSRQLGPVTGDAYGASVEASFAASLVASALLP